MAGIRIRWAQFGGFDSFSVLRSNNPMELSELPEPIITGLAEMTFFDTSIVDGAVYYYRVIAIKGAEQVVSDEIRATAYESDPYFDKVLYLLKLEGSLFDDKLGINMTWNGGGAVPYVDVSSDAKFFSKAISFSGNSKYVADPRTITTAQNFENAAYTIELFVRTYANTSGVPLSFGSISGDKLSWWLNLTPTGINLAQSTAGRGQKVSFGANIPQGLMPLGEFAHIAITRQADGAMSAYVNGVRINQGSLPNAMYQAVVGLRIGVLDYFPSYTSPFIGDIGAVRITKGVARYTEATLYVPRNFPSS